MNVTFDRYLHGLNLHPPSSQVVREAPAQGYLHPPAAYSCFPDAVIQELAGGVLQRDFAMREREYTYVKRGGSVPRAGDNIFLF